jgi:hypothetical protein
VIAPVLEVNNNVIELNRAALNFKQDRSEVLVGVNRDSVVIVSAVDVRLPEIFPTPSSIAITVAFVAISLRRRRRNEIENHQHHGGNENRSPAHRASFHFGTPFRLCIEAD